MVVTLRWNDVRTLREEHEWLISRAAREVCQLNRERGTVSKHWTADTPIELDRQHAGAVVAFCWMVEIVPILVRPEWTGGVGKIHGYLDDGRSVAIKQTAYEHGQLLVEEDEPRVADLYILMVGVSPTYAYRGWEAKDGIFRPTNLTWGYRNKDKRPSQRYHLRQWRFANARRPDGFLQRDLELA